MSELQPSTKLYVHQPHRELAPRSPLAELLDTGLRGKLTLVSALPASYSKTTKVATRSRALRYQRSGFPSTSQMATASAFSALALGWTPVGVITILKVLPELPLLWWGVLYLPLCLLFTWVLLYATMDFYPAAFFAARR